MQTGEPRLRFLRRHFILRLALSATFFSAACLGAQVSASRASPTSGVEDGVRNAIQSLGADVGEKINAAFADCGSRPCTVFVPAGDYHYKTPIVIPALQSPTLRMDSGAHLYYDGDGRAVSTSRRTGRVFMRGGHIIGNPAAKVGILLMPETQGVFIDEVDVKGFSGGDGILDIGTNVVKITNAQVRDNLYGVHLMGAPGYASNNVTITGSTIVGSSRWGIVDGDVTQFPANWMGTGLGPGTSSPELGNAFLGNDLEINGRDPSGRYGAVLEALTYKSVFSGNYFEGSPRNMVLGCLNGPDPVYQRLYSVKGPNCGTSVSTTVRDNYFTAGAAIEVELYTAVDAVIDANAELGSGSNCFASITGAASGSYVSSNHIDGSSKANNNKGEWLYCHGSGPGLTPGWPDEDRLPSDVNIGGSSLYFNHQGQNVPAGKQMIRYTKDGPPPGYCTPAWSPGAIWMNTTTGQMFVCQADSIAPHGGAGSNPGDGHATWVAK